MNETMKTDINNKNEERQSRTICEWATFHELFLPYHDEEWGDEQHDDRMLFEMLCLEGAQAGVSWLLVLKKRVRYKELFHDFDPEKIVAMSDEELESCLQDPGIIRNRLKVYGVRKNAEAFLKVTKEFGTFDRYIWQFVGGKPIRNSWATQRDVPTSTAESDAMAKDLKKRGFKFVGTTICYSYMQAVGMVNDHTQDCWKHGK